MEVNAVARRLALALGLALAASGVLAQPEYRLRVDGLACPFCAYGIEKKLGAIEGVARVETDIVAGTVTVTMSEGTTLDEASARRAVKEAGFSLRSFEPAGRVGEQAK